ncbi:MAG: amidohydrolase [Thermoplasmata archaeon]|nr:amidohydrolase [Thermoplasmata archaeon]
METPEPHAWVGGRIFTGTRWVEALLAENGRVAAVGSGAQVRSRSPPGTITTALDGRLVVPGLIDPHLHWLGSVVDAAGVDLRGTRSVPELQDRLARAAEQHPRGPLIGSGWDQERLAERRYPTRADLDRIVSSRPVVLYRICHHAAVTNTPALEATGVAKDTPDPVGGRIGRESSGEPNGLLFDGALRRLRSLSLETFESRASEAARFLHHLSARGLTTIGAMSALAGEARMAIEAHAGAGLPVRLRFYLLADEWDGRTPARGRERGAPKVIGLKFVLDGSLGARTAWLEAPYADDPAERGISLAPHAEVGAWLDRAANRGMGVALHAIGDRAVREAVSLLGTFARGASPPRIEHASVLNAGLLERLVALRPVLVVQPQFVTSDTWIRERLGPERARWAYPFRTLIDRGLVVAGSSDAPIESYDPWASMAVAVGHCGLTPIEALGLYTGAAATSLNEPGLGRLELGSEADLVWLEATTVEGAIAAGGPVRGTWKAGSPVGERAPG